eukprot:15458147-Alexandrium_andersonii.AAC.1
MGASDFRRRGAAKRAIRPVGRAWTAAPSGWILGPGPTLNSHQSDRLGVPTGEHRKMQNCFRRSKLELR